MFDQKEFVLPARKRGCYLITEEIKAQLPQLPKEGLLNLFCKHTSCAITINENQSPEVRQDLTAFLDQLIPEGSSYIHHDLEGSDDMPSHAKTALTGVSVTIPITHGQLNLGDWQGVYLCEYRDQGIPRHVVATIIS